MGRISGEAAAHHSPIQSRPLWITLEETSQSITTFNSQRVYSSYSALKPRLNGAIIMRIIDSADVIVEEDIETESSIRLIPTDEVIDQYFPLVKFHRNEFDEYFGHGVPSKDQRKNSANPVFAEFRRVQNELHVLASSKKSYGDKRRISSKLLQDFKAFLRTKNIRYRNLWRQLEMEAF